MIRPEVAASFDSDRDDAPRTSRILRQNEAMRFNSQTGTVQSIALERERFALSWDDVLYKPNLSIGIVFERTIPPSIGPDDFSSDDTMYLFLEKTGVTLSEELAVNVSMPGTYNRFEGTCAILPAGTVVDSYLIHYNPVNKLGTHTKTSTTIAFPRSIVGLIVDTEKLHGSDGILGRERTHYPGNDLGRGLEAASAGVTPSSDRITWTDRRQLQVTLGANLYDQMRVLIASPNLGNEP